MIYSCGMIGRHKNPKTEKKRSRKIIKQSFFCFLIFLSFVFFVFGPAQASSKEEESLFVAKKAFEDGFYEVSLGLLDRFLKNYPDSKKYGKPVSFCGPSIPTTTVSSTRTPQGPAYKPQFPTAITTLAGSGGGSF